ncbi:MAG: hypothetical protein RLZZ44_635 [Bacteroidota bacterium]|jgi:hypothetical protein
MAYSEHQADRIRARLIGIQYAEKKMMGGFLFINSSGFDLEEDLDFWISKALEFNSLLICE